MLINITYPSYTHFLPPHAFSSSTFNTAHTDSDGIPEDTENGSTVAFAWVADADLGQNGNVTLTLESGDPDDYFRLEQGDLANTYILKLNRQLSLQVLLVI